MNSIIIQISFVLILLSVTFFVADYFVAVFTWWQNVASSTEKVTCSAFHPWKWSNTKYHCDSPSLALSFVDIRVYHWGSYAESDLRRNLKKIPPQNISHTRSVIFSKFWSQFFFKTVCLSMSCRICISIVHKSNFILSFLIDWMLFHLNVVGFHASTNQAQRLVCVYCSSTDNMKTMTFVLDHQ